MKVNFFFLFHDDPRNTYVLITNLGDQDYKVLSRLSIVFIYYFTFPPEALILNQQGELVSKIEGLGNEGGWKREMGGHTSQLRVN